MNETGIAVGAVNGIVGVMLDAPHQFLQLEPWQALALGRRLLQESLKAEKQ